MLHWQTRERDWRMGVFWPAFLFWRFRWYWGRKRFGWTLFGRPWNGNFEIHAGPFTLSRIFTE